MENQSPTVETEAKRPTTGLSPDAYTYNPGKEYKPYISAETNLKEFTARAVIIGCVISVVFGAANAYLAMLIGMTISASIPAAVIGMALLKAMKNGNVLENTIIQTTGSTGESLAAGIGFTLPALLLLNIPVSMVTVFVIACTGGILGILIMIPLRKFLIKDEHGKIPYPEGTACAEVLVAGNEGGTSANMLFKALGLGAGFKFLTDGIVSFPYTSDFYFKEPLKGGGFGMDFLPSLFGAGFLVGPRICAYSLAGGILGWFVIMPMIYYFGQYAPAAVAPGVDAIGGMDMWGMWSKYIKYVGIGCVTMGGFISLLKSIPIIVRSFKGTFKNMNLKAEEVKRTDQNVSGRFIIIGVIFVLAVIAFLPVFPSVAAGSVGAILVLIFGFFFVTVSSHIVGLVGSSSNPIAAMTIGGLLVTAVVFRAMGFNGTSGITATLVVGSVLCIAIGVSGDMSQDLKTGFLLGSTPKKQQYGQIFGLVTAATVMGAVIIMLNDVYVIGSEKLPAPHANMMKAISEGIMTGSLPWGLIVMGMGIAVMVYLLGGSVLPFAVGLYLPIHLSTAMMLGGILKGIIEKKQYDTEIRNKKLEKGTLYASGFIAGDALMGVIVTALLYSGIDLSAVAAGIIPRTDNMLVSLAAYLLLCGYFAYVVFSRKHEDQLGGLDLKM